MKNPKTIFIAMVRLVERRQAWCAGITLALYLFVYIVYTCLNNQVIMTSDEYDYLKSAQSLLHGSFTIDHPIFSMLKARFPDMNGEFAYVYISPAGKLVSVCTVGIAEFFAPLVALFGTNLFVLTPILCTVIALACLFVFAAVYFRSRGERYSFGYALLCVAVFALVIGSFGGIRRDVIGSALTMVISVLVLLAARRKKWVLWQTACAVLLFLFTIKVSFVLLYAPFGLFLFSSMKGYWKSARFVFGQICIAACISAVILTPFFMQNHACTGHWYLMSQSAEASSFLPYEVKGGSWPVWLLTNAHHLISAQLLIFGFKGAKIAMAGMFALFACWGIWREKTDPFVRWWILPSLILTYALYFSTAHMRSLVMLNLYLAPTYCLTVFLCVCGIRGLLSLSQREGIILVIVLFSILMPVSVLKTYKSLPNHRENCFRVSDARALAADISSIVPGGGVLLCNKFPSIYIEYFSRIYSFPTYVLWTKDSDAADKIAFLLESNVPVYYCDYKGYDDDFYRFYNSYLPGHFQAKPVKQGQWLHHFNCATADTLCNIFQLLPRKKGNVER